MTHVCKWPALRYSSHPECDVLRATWHKVQQTKIVWNIEAICQPGESGVWIQQTGFECAVALRARYQLLSLAGPPGRGSKERVKDCFLFAVIRIKLTFGLAHITSIFSDTSPPSSHFVDYSLQHTAFH